MVLTTILLSGDASSTEMMRRRTPSERRDTAGKMMMLCHTETPYLEGTRPELRATAKMTAQVRSTFLRNRPKPDHPSKANTLGQAIMRLENRGSSQVQCFRAHLKVVGLGLRLEFSI